MKEKKRLTASERKALMHMFAALEGMANLQQLGGEDRKHPRLQAAGEQRKRHVGQGC